MKGPGTSSATSGGSPRRRPVVPGPSDLAETRIATVLGLKQFMQGPINTLLIKGLAGTGKTTVALEILKAAGQGKGAYISSRVPKGLLETHIPAMKETIDESRVPGHQARGRDIGAGLCHAADRAQEDSGPSSLTVGTASRRNWTRRRGYGQRRP